MWTYNFPVKFSYSASPCEFFIVSITYLAEKNRPNSKRRSIIKTCNITMDDYKQILVGFIKGMCYVINTILKLLDREVC